MTETPQNAEEFMQRFQKNQAITGHGIDETEIHFPCPFCAAPDFIVTSVLQIEPAMLRDNTCTECGRSGRSLVEYGGAGSITMEFVQTGGDAAPHYLSPGYRYLHLPQYG